MASSTSSMPPAGRYAVWNWDSSAVWASTSQVGPEYPATTSDVMHFALGTTPGAVAFAGGRHHSE